jgi:flagellar biosynthesis protein FlhF
MTRRHYQGRTVAEAVARAKGDLGRDAVILQARRIPAGGVLGWLTSRRQWEVVAGDAAEIFDSIGKTGYASGSTQCPTQTGRFQPQPDRQEGKAPVRLEAEVRRLGRLVEQALQRNELDEAGLGEPISRRRRQLRDQGIAPRILDAILLEAAERLDLPARHDAEAVDESLQAAIAARIRTAAPKIPDGSIVALVGPTGAGKTTTLAKLAARCRLDRGQSVGLITMDTYRIAAVDQLRTYAEIIDVPLATVISPGEMARAVHDMQGRDVILIDTAGRSQKQADQLRRLGAFVNAAGPDQVHLVAPASGSTAWLDQVAEAFGPVGADRLILTKLDEAVALGAAVNLSQQRPLALSYVTTGQDVPQEIEPADAERLAGWILQGPREAE